MIPNTLLAFEVLMQETPYSHFDSGCDGITPECRTCRFHRPHWKYQSCVFQFCPYSPIAISTRKEKLGRGEVFPGWIKRKERIAIPSFACSLIETTLSLTL